MKTLPIFYDFFKLSEEEAHSWIGTPFMESDAKYSKNSSIYFPIGLSNKWENYGYSTGLIFVSQIHPERPATKKYKGYPKWFRCGLASPDDGDVDLDFEGEEVRHRQAVLDFMQSMPWYDTSIYEVLEMVQAHVKAGLLNGKKYSDE